MHVKGISVSEGFAKGRIKFLETAFEVEALFQGSDIELQNLKKAIENSKQQVQELVQKLRDHKPAEAEIFEAHILMLEDPEILNQVQSKIQNESVSSVAAYKATLDEYIQIFSSLEDAYMRQRATDLKDIQTRVLANLSSKGLGLNNLTFDEDVLLFAEDLTPSQTASLDLTFVKGFITQFGGKTSHSAILARALEIPAVTGISKTQLSENSYALLDALDGTLKLNPSKVEESSFQSLANDFTEHKKEFLQYKNQKSETIDHHVVELAANIGNFKDLESVKENDAEAVGLYRTEFVFMDQKEMPSEETQYAIYSEVFENLSPKKCIIRTLDIGGDKKLDYLKMPEEMNPFLGLRAVRLCLQQPQLFKNQIKAILRAAQTHEVWIMIPMISKIEEIIATKKIFQECKDELGSLNIPYSDNYKLGVMIEIPSAALMIDKICDYVDFISIGTNDLIQYMCAVDRMNTSVECLYDPYHPGFLRLMKTIIHGAKAKSTFVGICGSVAHKTDLVPYFVGLGVDELSMTAQHVLPTRKIIRNLQCRECVKLTDAIDQASTSEETRAILKNFFS